MYQNFPTYTFTVLCVGEIKGKSVLLFPYCTLQKLKCAVFAQVPENIAHLGKQHTWANTAHLPNITSHCKHRLSFASITIAELEVCCIPLYTYTVTSPQGEGKLPFILPFYHYHRCPASLRVATICCH